MVVVDGFGKPYQQADVYRRIPVKPDRDSQSSPSLKPLLQGPSGVCVYSTSRMTVTPSGAGGGPGSAIRLPMYANNMLPPL